MGVRIWLMVWVRALTALLRTTRMTRIAFTAPSLDFRVPGARPERIAVASA